MNKIEKFFHKFEAFYGYHHPPEEQNIIDSMHMFTDDDTVLVNDDMTAILIYKHHGNNIELQFMYVLPDFRKKHIGRFIVCQLIAMSHPLTIWTNPYTTEAGQFFGKIGFVEDQTFDPKDTNVMVYTPRK